MSEPLRTSKEDGHFHYYRIDEDGNGRTSMYVDKATKTKHFHRITKFQVEDAGLEEHSHELRGGRLSNVAKTNKDDVSAAANDYLRTLGYVSIAYAWIKVLEVSFKDYNENKNFYDDKIATARFYFDKVLPRAEQHFKTAISGSSNLMNFKFN